MVFKKLVKQELNVDIVSEYKFLEDRKFRFDYAIPDFKIAIEKEGGVYTRGAHGSITGILRDIEKYNLATINDWSVLRVLPENLLTMKTIEMIEQLINLKK